MLLGGEEAVFVGQRLLPCQKRSCTTPYKETSSHSMHVRFGYIGKWPWTQFFSRIFAVDWLTDTLIVLFPWSIVWNAQRRRFEHGYQGRMTQKRCHFCCTILSFWFYSSRCPSVSILHLDFSVLQANWRASKSVADFHFLCPTSWIKWRPFFWLCILPPWLVLLQLRFPASFPSRLLDRTSQCTLCGRAALIGWLGANVTLAEISWTRNSGYTWTSFCLAIKLLSTLCWECVVPTDRYGSFCDARCLELQRNAVLGIVDSFSVWLGLRRE